MNPKKNVLKRKLSKALIFICVISLLLITGVLIYIQTQQERILQNQITKLNTQHTGLIEVGKSNLSLFGNFPYISLKIDDVKIFETKSNEASEIMHVKDIYVGFNLWDIVNQNYDIQSIIIEDGVFNLILHKDGSNNLEIALKNSESNTDAKANSVDIHLKKIKLKNLDIHKLDESTNTDIETFVFFADGGFKKNNNLIDAHINSEFKLNVIKALDTTYIKNKFFEFDTDITYNDSNGLLSIAPTKLVMEHANFELEGVIKTKQNMDLDLKVKGNKSNFDAFIAFAPHDLIPVLERYKNAGNIYFNAEVKGELQNDKPPFFDVNFGTDKAYLENTKKKKRITDVGFNGHFTNGKNRDLESMEFSITNINATLDKGKFKGALVVKNFEHPEIKADFDADFNIKFITDFFNINNIKTTSGNIALKMNFHDIVDFSNPELALNNLNSAYFSELKIKDLQIDSEDLPAPLEQLNAHVVMNGKAATINSFNLLLGKSDLSITGYLSNLPAVIHQTEDTVSAHLDVTSKLIDIAELTQFSAKNNTGIDEQITKFNSGLSFKGVAKDFKTFKHLPKSEFFIDSLNAQLKHYPHKFHDFHADVLIDEVDLKIVDFTGYIDDSDFHLNGLAHHYEFWLKDSLNGDVDLDLTLTSNVLKLEDLFSYKAENYVPKEYRHEAFDKLTLHVNTHMHYKNSTLNAIDFDLEKLQTKLKLHPNTFEEFKGRFHYEDEHLTVNDFHGQIGKTIFDIDLNYYLGTNDSIKKRDNHLGLKANYIDYDALFQFNSSPTQSIKNVENANKLKDVTAHSDAFNIYELPFTDMTFDVAINHFIYHKIDVQNIKGKLRTTPNHYLYIDTLNLDAAGGHLKLSGYFNGSDPKQIYFKPKLELENVNLDKLLFKFENFGQDHLVSENLHGKITSEINGTIRVYPDMVPNIDKSEIHMKVKVLDGKLENYEPMELLSDYIGNKNLKSIRFDTLQNNIDVNKGKLIIPNMTIESTLGHIEIAGTHDSQHNIEYYLKIPMKTAKKAALYKVFGDKKKTDSIYNEETIIKKDTTKNTKYLNLKIQGTVDDYEISLKKQKTN